jgi:uncharacterized membrane protein YfcA
MPIDLVSGFLAGALNSVAGGGSFLTFPALVFAGVPPVIANATSTVALFPATFTSAWAYRHDLASASNKLPLRPFIIVSVLGGALGAWLLLRTPDSTFEVIVPWLLLFATVIFTFGRTLSRRIRQRVQIGLVTLVIMQSVIGIYGGYFGGGIGILMLAMLGLYGLDDIHAMNGMKTILSSCMNVMAGLIFMVKGAVWWDHAWPMLLAAMAGGWAGPALARRAPPDQLRLFVSFVGITMTLYFFWRTYH